ncbi:MAG: hypothetical protein GXW99_09355 [Clostridiales bacterium]|nr:hypothetical protein [Clostridiales bacterium]
MDSLAIITFLLATTLLSCFVSLDRASPGTASQTIYGSILFGANEGGYVLAGVLAFMAGVITAVFCIRAQKKKKYLKQGEEEENEKKNVASAVGSPDSLPYCHETAG